MVCGAELGPGLCECPLERTSLSPSYWGPRAHRGVGGERDCSPSGLSAAMSAQGRLRGGVDRAYPPDILGARPALLTLQTVRMLAVPWPGLWGRDRDPASVQPEQRPRSRVAPGRLPWRLRGQGTRRAGRLPGASLHACSPGR